ncbi:MAG TPA: GNAT family N-acetyltransferase [Nocardioidaceae bacterium]|nr:GNAT family N-acetyltransferase [Nocardioidaceae bacterium]
MQIQTVRTADLDVDAAEELAALHNRANAVDAPHELVETAETMLLRLVHGWDGEGAERLLVARDDGGRALGFVELEMPMRENRGLIWFSGHVDPPARRQGVGSAMMRAVTQVCGEVGRDLLMSGAWEDSPGVAFLRHHGLEQASVAAKRRLYPHLLPRPGDEELLDAAREASAGYRLLRLVGPLPETLVEQMVATAAAINDAPLDNLELEDDNITADRLRRYDATQATLHHRLYRVVALDADGTPAAHTVVAVDGLRPYHAEQHDTTVRREHRGHRLGLRLKLEMLAWLREAEPQLTQADTWNQASNVHMIAVNDALGCVVVGREVELQRHVAVANRPGASTRARPAGSSVLTDGLRTPG